MVAAHYVQPVATILACRHCHGVVTGSRLVRCSDGRTPYCSLQCGRAAMRARNPLASRWAALVRKTESCWLWVGRRSGRGYGSMCARSERLGRTTNRAAHVISWELHYGKVPQGMMVCHHCDVRLCVRPDHLFLGTHDDNMRDMAAKGRNVRGERVGTSVLTEQQVLDIRRRADAGERNQSIADDFGITRQGVGLIARRINWAWLPESPMSHRLPGGGG